MRKISVNTILSLITIFMLSCRSSDQRGQGVASTKANPPVDPQNLATATFAGGCFWCMEPPFDELIGVVSTTSGYTGGHQRNPTYEEVSAGGTGHAEAVQVIYDSTQISYDQLLQVFWRNIDPLARNRQFCDAGSQYRSAIFYHHTEQRRLTEASKQKLEQIKKFDQPIATEIVPASTFYNAEEYHQDFYKKNKLHYKAYRAGCGRDRRLKELWGEEPSGVY
jgi:peptide-methionine (S)-S-oxide reductase